MSGFRRADGVEYTIEEILNGKMKDGSELAIPGYTKEISTEKDLLGYRKNGAMGVNNYLSLNALKMGYANFEEYDDANGQFTGELYTKIMRDLFITFPVTADISEYLQVAYNDTSLWSVGMFQLMDKTGAFDGAQGDLYGPALGQGGNKDSAGVDLDFSHGLDENGRPTEGSLWGVPAQVSAGSADIAGAPIGGVISVQNSVSAQKQHSIIMKSNGSLWAYGKNGNGRIGDGTSTSTDVPVRVGASYFILEDYTVSIREGESFQFNVEPRISAFNVFNNVEDESGNQEMAWFTWDAEEDSDWRTVDVNAGESFKTSVNDNIMIRYGKVDADSDEGKAFGMKYDQSDKRATITGLKAGTTYVLLTVANDSLIVGAFKVEVRPADEVSAEMGHTASRYINEYRAANASNPDSTMTGLADVADTLGKLTDRVNVIGQSNNNLADLNTALGTDYEPGTRESGGLYQGMYDSYDESAAGQGPNLVNLREDYGDSVAYPMLSSGTSFTVALAADGTVWTWGDNEYGELGVGTVYGTHAIPQQVIAQVRDNTGKTIRYEYLNNVRKIAAAGNFAYALKNDGTVWAWGRNDAGQLGLGSAYTYFTRVPYATQVLAGAQGMSSYTQSGSVKYMQEIVDIAVGGDADHGFAYMVQSVYYQTQNKVVDEENSTETEIKYKNAPVKHSLTNNIFGVGDNTYGQLDMNTTRNRMFNMATSVRVPSGIVSFVSGGASNTGHILVGNGIVMSMGSNVYGAIGNGAVTGTRGNALLPYRAMSVSGSRNGAMSAVFQLQQTGDGQYVSVANKKNGTDITGTFYAWGQINNAYVPSDTSATIMAEPVLVTKIDQNIVRPNYRGGVMLLGGDGVTYTVDGEGRLILSGGKNDYGELGRGTTHSNGSRNAEPRFVQNNDTATDAGTVDNDKTVRGVLSAASGEYHTTYVDNQGNVFAFGLDNMNQLGNQSMNRPYSTRPLEVSSMLTVEGVKDSVELVLQADLNAGTISSAKSTFDLSTNYEVAKGFNLLSIDSGDKRYNDLKEANRYGNDIVVTFTSLDPNVAQVDNDGSSATFGRITAVGYGQTDILVSVYDGYRTRTLQFHVTVRKPYLSGGYEPVIEEKDGQQVMTGYEFKTSSTAVANAMVAVGEDYTLVLKADGTVWAWGRNTWGQLGTGYGTVGGVESAPLQLNFTKIVGYQKPADLADDDRYPPLEDYYTVAGYNQRVTLAAGRSNIELMALQSFIPVYSDNQKIVKVAAGMDFAMAIDEDGTLYTWGRNNVGQMGNGGKNTGGSGSSERVFAEPVVVNAFRELHSSADPEAQLVITDIAAGAFEGKSFAMALAETGDIFVWGTSLTQQVSAVSGADQLLPIKAPVADVVDLAAASRMNSYVLDQMGTLLTWSVQDRSNMIQNVNTTDAGLASMTGDRIVSVDAGWNTVMAVTQNGDVWVKGDNSKGQLGFPVDPTAPETPVDPFTKSADLSGQDVRDVVALPLWLSRAMAMRLPIPALALPAPWWPPVPTMPASWATAPRLTGIPSALCWRAIPPAWF